MLGADMSSNSRLACCTLGVALVGATLQCNGPRELDGKITSLIVKGVVDDAAGAPVVGAIVHVSWRPAVCGGELQPFPPDTTSAGGEFEVNAWGWGTYAEACVNVRAEPPQGRDLQEASVEVDRIRLDSGHGQDTLSLRLTLHPI